KQQIEHHVGWPDVAAVERDRVGAGAEEHGVAERDLARLQQDDDAENDDPLREDQRQERDHAWRDERQKDDGREPDDEGAGHEGQAPHQILLAATVPNRPCGRSSSTTTMIRYGTSTSNSG